MKKESAKRERGIYKVTLQGSVVNLLLTVFKFFAGFYGQSSAMIADAVHSLSDFITDFVVLAFVRVSTKPQDENHDYGHGKYETLASAIIGFILLLVGVGILWSGGLSIYNVLVLDIPLESPGLLALIAALLSLVFKELLYGFTIKKGRQLKSKAVIANAWHHRSDALSSIGTSIGIGGAVLLGAKWSILDPIAAVVVSVLIIKEAISLLNSGLNELLEKSLSDEIEDEITAIVNSVEGVHGIEELRTRSIGNYFAIEFNMLVDGEVSLNIAHDHSVEVEERLIKRFGKKTHIGIHLEPFR